jgi:hypothetical protein
MTDGICNGCEDNTLDDCVVCVSNGNAPGNINNVVEMLINRIRKETSAPTANHDDSAGYEIGTIWINTTNDKSYICVDNTDGSAIWKELKYV